MPIRTMLTELLERIPGARGVLLADWEGEAVDQACRMDEYELKVVGAHKGIILTKLREAAWRQQGGAIREIVVETGSGRTVVLPITEDYFLVAVLEKQALLGQALFEARRCVDRLREEIL